jgi:hypothetical protein
MHNTNANTSSAATIAASLDIATVAGWNLRALLLRLLDGDTRMSGPDSRTLYAARDLYLIQNDSNPIVATPLGREVAERLRPKPWTASGCAGEWICDSNGHPVAQVHDDLGEHPDLGERIADLLTTADAEEAKRYKTETNA